MAHPGIAGKALYASCRRLVMAPRSPVPITRPSMLVTGVSSPMVPVVNTSSAAWNSARLTRLTSEGMPNCLASTRTVPRVTPGKQWSPWGVSKTPSSSTMKILVAFVSLTYPSMSSMIASAHPARLAWIFGKMLLIMLLWWILESQVEGEFRRCDAEINEMPLVLS